MPARVRERAPTCRARGAKEVILGTLAMRGAGCWRTLRVGRLNRPSLSRPPGRLRAQLARSAAKRSPPDPPAFDWSASGGLFGLHHCRSNSVARCLRTGGQRKVGGATGWPRRMAGSSGDAGRCCVAARRGSRGAPCGRRGGSRARHLERAISSGSSGGTSTYLNLPTYSSVCLAIGCTVAL